MQDFSQTAIVSPTIAPTSDEWERIRLEFIAEHEAGMQPTLGAFAARYPAYAALLTDFALDYLRMENAAARREASEAAQGIDSNVPTPDTIAVWEKTLATLGIPTKGIMEEAFPAVAPEVFTFSAPETLAAAEPSQTLTDLRKARNWSPSELGRRLSLPPQVTMKLETGRIGNWSSAMGDKLKAKIADVFSLTQENVERVLQATAASRSGGVMTAAFSADGDPDADAVAQNSQPESFEAALRAELAKSTTHSSVREFWEVK